METSVREDGKAEGLRINCTLRNGNKIIDRGHYLDVRY